MPGFPATSTRSAPSSTSRPRRPRDHYDARCNSPVEAQTARRAAPPLFQHDARPRHAASAGGHRLLRAVGNRRQGRLDFGLPGRLSLWNLRGRIQDDCKRRAAVGHVVHAVRGYSRFRHRHHRRIVDGARAVVFGVCGAAGRAFHCRHQQRAKDCAGADRRIVVRHWVGFQGCAFGIAHRHRRVDRGLSGRQRRRCRSAVIADLDGRGQAPGVLQGRGAVHAAIDHRDLPDQHRLWARRRRGRRIHFIAARARPPDLHRLQPLPWKQSNTTHQVQV